MLAADLRGHVGGNLMAGAKKELGQLAGVASGLRAIYRVLTRLAYAVEFAALGVEEARGFAYTVEQCKQCGSTLKPANMDACKSCGYVEDLEAEA